MTSIFPGGNALNAANITNKQQNESAELMEKISNGKRLTTGADDAGNISAIVYALIAILISIIITTRKTD